MRELMYAFARFYEKSIEFYIVFNSSLSRYENTDHISIEMQLQKHVRWSIRCHCAIVVKQLHVVDKNNKRVNV